MAYNSIGWKDVPFRVQNGNIRMTPGVSQATVEIVTPFTGINDKIELTKVLNNCPNNPVSITSNMGDNKPGIVIPWKDYPEDCGDTIFKLSYTEETESTYPVNTWCFISPDNGIKIPAINGQMILLGFMRSQDIFNVIEGTKDYAYFAHCGFEITDASEGLAFLVESGSSITDGTNVIKGIMVCEIPAEGDYFTFKVKSGYNNVEQTFVFARPTKDNEYIIPAGDCENEPVVIKDIIIPLSLDNLPLQSRTIHNGLTKFSFDYTTVSSQGYATLHIESPFNKSSYISNYIEGLPTLFPEGIYMSYSAAPLVDFEFVGKSISIKQAPSELNYFNTKVTKTNTDLIHGTVGELKDIVQLSVGCTNVSIVDLYILGESAGFRFESNQDWLVPIAVREAGPIEQFECNCKEATLALLVEPFKNNTTNPITGTVNIYIGDTPIGTYTITVLPIEINFKFDPDNVRVSYYTPRNLFALVYRDINTTTNIVTASIVCVTDPSIEGKITEVDATASTSKGYRNYIGYNIPSNNSDREREWVITALYKDGEYETTTEYHIYQEALQLEWDPAAGYMGNEGGDITTNLITNVENLGDVIFSGDIVPVLENEEEKSYKITVPENTETEPKTYDTKATVLLGSSRKEAIFTINQEAADYAMKITPNPLILPAGECNSSISPNAVAQIVSSYSSRLTIKPRSVAYNMSILDYSNTSIKIAADFNPTIRERLVGYIDFIYNNNIVYTLAVLQAANEFKWSCNNGCNLKFPASGGDKTIRITWNDDTISPESIVWFTDNWLKVRTIGSGTTECGESYVDLNVIASLSVELEDRSTTIKGVISGNSWSPVIEVIQEGAEKQFYFGCNSSLTIPATGASINNEKDCTNCVKLYFNTPNEANIQIGSAYGGLTMDVGELEQENTGLWSKRLCFGVGVNYTQNIKTWNIPATWGTTTITLNIKQAGALYLRCNPSEMVFYRDGGNKFLALDTPIGPSDIEVINNNPDKLTLVPWGTNSYSVRIGANYYKNAIYSVTFRYKKDPSIQCTAKIYQIALPEGSDYIFCNPSMINRISEYGGEYDVEVITNLPENNIGVELGPNGLIPPGWQLIRDVNNYKKAKVFIPSHDCSDVRNATVTWFPKNMGSSKVTGCSTFIEQCTPTPPYLYFKPSEDEITYRGGEVVTYLLSGWEVEPSIDYSGLKGLSYTVEKNVYERDCQGDTSNCPNRYEKIWTIKIKVPETDDWQDTVYTIVARGQNNMEAEYILTQKGKFIAPAVDAEACSCNLLNTMGLEALDRYFKHLSQFGYKSYADVDRLLVLGFIEDILNSDIYFCISEEDYRIIMNALYCIINKTCLVDYPVSEVYDSLIHPIITDPDTLRETEDNILRYSERGCNRIEEK